MPREDWRSREDERRMDEDRYGRRARRADAYDAYDPYDDDDRLYDPDRGEYRRLSEGERAYARRMDEGDYRPVEEPSRSWADRAGSFFSGGPARHREPPRRRGPSDRVLWAVIVERLEDERRLDLRDVDVFVEDCEVTLNGTVRRKEDKRRIEDVADIDGIRHVQNNLRVRGRDHWTFI
jgi:hypothetical protein